MVFFFLIKKMDREYIPYDWHLQRIITPNPSSKAWRRSYQIFIGSNSNTKHSQNKTNPENSHSFKTHSCWQPVSATNQARGLQSPPRTTDSKPHAPPWVDGNNGSIFGWHRKSFNSFVSGQWWGLRSIQGLGNWVKSDRFFSIEKKK